MTSSVSYLALGLPGGYEWILLAILGLLLFGKRLPEVGKSLGRSIVEFKKGLRGIEEDIDKAVEEDQKEMLPPPEPSRSTPKPEQTVAQGNSHSAS